MLLKTLHFCNTLFYNLNQPLAVWDPDEKLLRGNNYAKSAKQKIFYKKERETISRQRFSPVKLIQGKKAEL